MIAENELKQIDGVNGQVEIMIPDNEAPAEELIAVAEWLSKFSKWNLNPKGVSLANFDFQFYVGTWSVVPGFPRPFHVYFAAKHKSTGKAQGGFAVGVRSHYGTAAALVALAQE